MEVGGSGAEEVSTTVEVLGQGEEFPAASSSSSSHHPPNPPQQQMIIVRTTKDAKDAQGGPHVRRAEAKSVVIQPSQPMTLKQSSPSVSQSGVTATAVAAKTTAAPGSKVQYYRVMPATDLKGALPPPATPAPKGAATTPKAGQSEMATTAASTPTDDAASGAGGSEKKPAPTPRSRKKAVLPNGNRKPCNCTKSMCLKLYCDCFANGEFCSNCNCKDCHNNLDHEGERTKAIKQSLERNPHAFQPKIVGEFCSNCNCKDCHNNLDHEGERTKAIKQSLERNPHAFQPKIGKGKGRSEVDRMHQKGCHCKKSSCLKNYCECYEAKVPCSSRCKCQGCRNTEADREAKGRPGKSAASVGLLGLASAASSADLRSDTPLTETSEPSRVDPKSMPWTYMTDEVVECTTLCLMAQAEELEKGRVEAAEAERRVLREFGRCLHQIIANAQSAANAAGETPSS